jgi:hypothetical protein
LIEEFAMTHDANKTTQPKKKSGADKLVIAIMILGFATLVTYQIFFCPTCYGITERFMPATEKTDVK